MDVGCILIKSIPKIKSDTGEHFELLLCSPLGIHGNVHYYDIYGNVHH